MPQYWEVVGGSEHGGLLVREGSALSSRQLPERLVTGSQVQELALAGERLNFQLVSGCGPASGWISTTTRGKPLVRLLEPSSAAETPKKATQAAPGKPPAKLTRQQAWDLQEELLQSYGNESFQRRLLERWTAAGPDPVERAKVRQEVCFEVQGPIVVKYGFEASRKGVAQSVHCFRAPELMHDPELAERNAHLAWLTDPGQRQDGQDVQQPLPPPPPAPSAAQGLPCKAAAARVQLTLEQASAMQDELIKGYKKEEFQLKLHAAWHAAGDSPQKKLKARQQVCLEVQGPIVAKYGFDASLGGVMYSLMVFSQPHIVNDPGIQWKNAQMMLLIDPDEQAKQRKSGLIRVWDSESTLLFELTVDITSSVQALKAQVADRLSTAWYSQSLMREEHELHDRWPLDSFVPQDGAADIWLEPRRPEITEWLARLASGPETREQARCLAEVPPELLTDQAFMLPACQLSRWALSYAAPELRATRHIVEAALWHAGGSLEYASEELRADRELVLLAVTGDRGDAWSLQYAAAELRGDRELVAQAVQKDGWAIQFAAEDVLADRDIALMAAQREGWVLSSVTHALQADKEVVLTAVRQNWEVLEVVLPQFRIDKEVVLAAVKQDGWALEFAAPELQADREVVLLAVADVGEALRFADPSLQADREVALVAVSVDGLALSMVPSEIHDFELVLAAVRKDLRALHYVDVRFRSRVLEALGFASGQAPSWMGGLPSVRGSKPGRSETSVVAALAKHFQAMGLDQNATISAVRKRYRVLALEHHPDKHPEDPQKATETFQKINVAYQAIREALNF